MFCMRFNLSFFERLLALTQKHQVTPLLVSLTLLFLLFYPASQVLAEQVSFQAKSLALAFGLTSTVICLGAIEASRKKRIKYSALSLWLFVFGAVFSFSAFYKHTLSEQAFYPTFQAFFVISFFIALQQFHFLYRERQYLLWLPLLLGWFYFPTSLTLLASSLFPPLEIFSFKTPSQESPGVILLTSLALSAYLLARSTYHKKPWSQIHIPLLLTPLLAIPSIMAWQQTWLFCALILSFLMVQAFLFKYSSKALHLAWNCFALLGFVLGLIGGYLPLDANFYPLFSSDEKALLTQTFQLISTRYFDGVGFGQLEHSLALFSQTHGEAFSAFISYPSWILMLIAEGGITTWLPLLLLFSLIFKRLIRLPAASCLILLAILMPSLLGMVFTDYASTQPLLLLLFILLLYWLDSLSSNTYRLAFKHTKWIPVVALITLLSISVLTTSSLFLSLQATEVYSLNNNQIKRFALHPWWQDFYQKQIEERYFLQSLLEQNQEAQNAFLAKKIKQITQKPTPSAYQDLIKLALQTQNYLIAEQIRDEAKQLFPTYDFNLAPLDKRLLSNLP